MENLNLIEDEVRAIRDISIENGIMISMESAEYIHSIISRSKKNQLWVSDISDKEILDIIIEYIT